MKTTRTAALQMKIEALTLRIEAWHKIAVDMLEAATDALKTGDESYASTMIVRAREEMGL